MLYIIDSEQRRKEVAGIVSRLLGSPVHSVEIKPYKRNRSLAQNRAMWMWYGVLADHLGCEAEDIHEQMKVKVLGVERKMVAGQVLIMPKSTTTLDVEGMSRFMEAIQALAADLEVVLPLPDDFRCAMYGARAA
jgi:hypothetical protein